MQTSYFKKFDLAGKVAIITGASNGIGKSMAEALAESGAKVVVSSRKQESVDAVANGINETEYQATGIACHVGKKTNCEIWLPRQWISMVELTY